jgi:methyl-accepting chemotaxis protein PixJ
MSDNLQQPGSNPFGTPAGTPANSGFNLANSLAGINPQSLEPELNETNSAPSTSSPSTLFPVAAPIPVVTPEPMSGFSPLRSSFGSGFDGGGTQGGSSLLTGASAKTDEEMTVLRGSIYRITDQLQELLQRGEAAAVVPRVLNRLTLMMRESTTLPELFGTVVNEARNALRTDRVIVYTFDTNWKGTVVAESVGQGFPAALGAKIADPCFADRYVKPYMKGRISATANIFEAGLTECHLKQLTPYGVKANLVVPILANQKLYGLLIAHQCDAPRQWVELETEFFTQLARQLGYAIDQITVIAQQAANNRQALLLNQIVSKVRESLQPDEIFAVASEQARQALKADRVIVYTFNDKWQGTVVSESVERGWRPAMGETIADPCFAERYVEPYRRGRVSATSNIFEAGLTECHLSQLAPYGVKANLVVPILTNQKLYGLLIAHQCDAPRQWQETEIDFFKQVAVQVGFALEQALLLQRQKTAAQQAQLLNQLSRRVQQASSLKEVYDTAVEDARVALKADRVIVYNFDEQWRGTIVAEAIGRGVKVSLGDKIHDPCFADAYVKYYQRGQVTATADIAAAGLTECHLKQLEPYGVKANLVVPILASRQLHGLLIAHQCSGPRQWQESDIDFLRQLGIQLGFALDQAENQRKLAKNRSLEQSATLVINRMRQSLETEKIFTTATRELRQLLSLDRVGIYRFSPDWGGEFIAESVGVGFPALVGPDIKTVWDDTYLQETEGGRYKNNETATVNDVHEVGHTQCHVDILDQFGIRAYVIAPIFVRNQLWGLLGAYQSSSTRNWEESETVLVTRVAEQLGAAISQSEFFQELQLKTDELRRNAQLQEKATARAELLNQIISNVRRSLKTQDIFNATVTNVQSAMNADRVLVFTFAENWEGTVTAEAVLSEYPETLGVKIADPCFAETYVKLYQRGRVQATDDTQSLSECHRGELAPFQVKANLVAPILSNNHLHGLLIAHQCSGPRQWQPEEVEFFRQVALQVGFALDQALALANAEAARQEAEQLTIAQRAQNEALQSQIRTLLNDIRGSFEGDLTVRARLFEGEMGTVADFFNVTLENLQDLVQEVKGATLSVSQMSRDNGTQVNAVADEGRRQANAIMAALTKLQTMAASMQGMAASAQQAQQQVAQGSEVVANSDRAMNEMVRSIKTVQQTVDKTAKKVKRLGDASQNISRIVSLMGDLARQTNILSLNASIDPQAGGNSQGFGMIATEVQALAEQSTEAAKEIEQIIAQIQIETAEAVSAMESSQQQVVLSTQLVDASRRQLGQITESSQQIQQIVEQIARVATTEVSAAQDLSAMMQEVAGIADQTVSQSNQLAESFNRLLGVTDNLQASVSQFKVE